MSEGKVEYCKHHKAYKTNKITAKQSSIKTRSPDGLEKQYCFLTLETWESVLFHMSFLILSPFCSSFLAFFSFPPLTGLFLFCNLSYVLDFKKKSNFSGSYIVNPTMEQGWILDSGAISVTSGTWLFCISQGRIDVVESASEESVCVLGGGVCMCVYKGIIYIFCLLYNLDFFFFKLCILISRLSCQYVAIVLFPY